MKNISLGFLFFLSACGYSNTKLPNSPSRSAQRTLPSRINSQEDQALSSNDPFSDPTFNDIKEHLFEPYCLSCHSESSGNTAGVNLETYQNTFSLAPKILKALETGRMPMTGTLPDESIHFFKKWIENGMPARGVQEMN